MTRNISGTELGGLGESIKRPYRTLSFFIFNPAINRRATLGVSLWDLLPIFPRSKVQLGNEGTLLDRSSVVWAEIKEDKYEADTKRSQALLNLFSRPSRPSFAMLKIKIQP